MKFLIAVKAWIVKHVIASIAIGAAFVGVVTTAIVVPVAVSNNKKKNSQPAADPTYTVTWKNADGTILEKDEEVKKGSTPSFDGATPTQAATAQYTYTFNGWEPALAEVNADVTYTAKFSSSVNSYSVKFLDEDGVTELKSETLEYGAIPVAPVDPTKADTAEWDYSFNGWDKEIASVEGNQTYTATYSAEKQKYLVQFLDEDETTVLKSEYVDYGATPVAPADPTKADTAEWDYSFDGWDKEISEVHAAQTYIATYSATKQKYLVQFLDDDETTVLKSETLDYGATPVAPADPTKADTAEWDYSFNGWDKEISEVHAAQTYIATYSGVKQKYTITWKDDNGSVLKTEKVDYGTIPSYGTAPEKAEDEGHTYAFNCWSPTPAEVTGEAEYTATYTSTLKKFNVVFKDYDGTVLGTKEMSYDDLMSGALCPVETEPTRADDGNLHYQFIGWDRAYTNVYPDTLVYTASYLQYYLSTDKYYVESLTTSFFEGEVIIPDTFREKPVTQIHSDAFKNRRIGGISIGKNVNYIGENAFEGCEIESISIPGTVGTIDACAFRNTTKLQEVTFHEGTSQIRSEAFLNSGIKELVLPASVSFVGARAFKNCLNLYKVTMLASSFEDYNNDYYSGIFDESGSITECLLPNTDSTHAYSFGYEFIPLVRLVGEEATTHKGTFDIVPADKETHEVSKIYYTEFGGSDRYLVGSFQDDMEYRILHADDAKYIKKYAFQRNQNIDEIIIGDEIREIGPYAFAYNSKTTKLEFEEGTDSLSFNSNAFQGLDNIESVDMSTRPISSVSSYAFSDCTNLISVTFSENTSYIGGYAFAWCYALEDVELPKALSSIDNEAFNYSPVVSYSIDENNSDFKTVDDVLFSKNGKTLYLFPGGKMWEDNIYVIPEGTESILCRAFSCGTVEEIVLPSTLKNFYQFAIYRLSTLTKVSYNGTQVEYEATSYIHAQAIHDCKNITYVSCSGEETSTKGVS